jgi:site-specific DNA-methyltransferase (adenine-specific)
MASEVRHGDCLGVVRGLATESVDLVYVDPPFFTQKTHSLVTRDRTTLRSLNLVMSGSRAGNIWSSCGFV